MARGERRGKRGGEALVQLAPRPGAYRGGVSRLVIVAPLRPGSREQALRLLEHGPPFELGESGFDRHQVYLSDREAIFLFEADGDAALRLPAEDLELMRAADAWRECLAGAPRVASEAFSWERVVTPEGVSFAPTPGPGDSEGGDVYPP